MKNLMAAFITALLVFTLATVWSDLIEPRLAAMSYAASSKANDTHRRSARSAADDESEELAKKRSRQLRESQEQKERLLSQLEKVKDEESKLLERQQTMKILYEDIFKVLAEDEEARRRSAKELAWAEKRFQESSPAKTAANANNAALAAQAAQRKAIAEHRIAGMVEALANQGNMSAAAILLSGLKEREAAKVLSVLNARNPRLALRLSNQVQAARQDTNAKF